MPTYPFAVPSGTNLIPSSSTQTVGSRNNPFLTASATNISGSSSPILGTYQGATAWCSWDQANSTPTISGSYNVSSLVDGGVGLTTVIFTNTLGVSTYAPVGSCSQAAGSVGVVQLSVIMPTGIKVETRSTAGAVDFKINSINVFIL